MKETNVKEIENKKGTKDVKSTKEKSALEEKVIVNQLCDAYLSGMSYTVV